ncbi:transcriptional regulator [Actinomycetospora sp. NBRC 106375]|uniref:MarR family winged helix-turn-helix transcriptional regulator n=1 Tax=Actinomycetospora sp. NBRC 106375 TaxID=3032207 RepID=UPI00249F9987|nr:MarR family winged helix-turn-helix transcriptional regulator [Actinomycetospora sp. NBRC 106375]GLZ50325.1 transcriptional regulator [Actinomycetospora sp. NBRC 106375]
MSDDERVPSPEQPNNTAALLGQAYSRLGHQIVDGVIAAGFPQRPAHSGVFAHIDLEGTRLTVLAERANMTPQAMKDLVDDLVRLGYVTRRPDPTDGRAKLVTLTERGRACIDASVEVIAGLERQLEALLGPEHLATVQDALTRILRHHW